MSKRVKGKHIKQNEQIRVEKESELLSYLTELFPARKKKLKAVLASRQVTVNGICVTRYNHGLKIGDLVEVQWVPGQTEDLEQQGIRIIFEDNHMVAVEKPQGMLAVSSGKQTMDTVYRHVNRYVQEANPKERIFVLHRLDRDTSGVMLFAKNKHLRDQLQKDWNRLVQERAYYAVVEGVPKQKKGRMDDFLFEDKQKKMRISHDEDKGKRAITEYEVEESSDGYSLIRFNIKTGRKNQIRVQMKSLGHPIVGDKKYGSTQDPLKRLVLHAWKLTLQHPVDGRVMTYQSEIPKDFTRLIRKEQ